MSEDARDKFVEYQLPRVTYSIILAEVGRDTDQSTPPAIKTTSDQPAHIHNNTLAGKSEKKGCKKI